MKEIIKLSNANRLFLGEEDYMDKITNLVSPILTANRKTGYFKSFDDTLICYEYYINSKATATVVISHGFCEFTAKFDEVIFYFFQAGYSVFMLDHRGHGYSKRFVEDHSKVHIHSYDEYVLDLKHFVTEIVLKISLQKKLILYAHSMGGAIAALFLEQYPEFFCCTILSSPMLEMSFGNMPVPIVGLIMRYKKLTRKDEEYVYGHGAFDGIPNFETSSCLSEVRYNHMFSKRLQDNHYQTYGASFAWTLESMKAIKKLQKNAKLVKTPILLFQAGRDTAVKAKGQKMFAKKSKNTQLVILPDSKHEIYNADTAIRVEYFEKIFAFLEKNIVIQHTKIN